MKKLALFFFLIISQFTNAQNLLSFSFEGRFVSGSGVPNFIPSNFNDAGITSSTIGRTGLGISPFGGEAMNCTGVSINTTEPVLTSYIEFRVTPQAGKKVSITGIEIAMLRSNGTGATKIVLRSSLDNFTSNLGGVIDFVNTTGNTNMVATQNFTMQDITSQIIFRVYPFAGIQNFGTWGIGGRTGNDLIVFGSSSDIVLPISLVKFSAEKVGEKVKIQWTTAAEINNEKFILDRSIDGENFETLHEITGAGNSKELNSYELVDHRPLKGTNYYRLTQVDFNGSSVSYAPIAVNIDHMGLSMTLGFQMQGFPSNKQGNLTCSIYSPSDSYAKISIHNMQGKIVHVEKIILTKGYQSLPLITNDLETGMYLVYLDNGKEKVQLKVIL
jgi:hypothetical protein